MDIYQNYAAAVCLLWGGIALTGCQDTARSDSRAHALSSAQNGGDTDVEVAPAAANEPVRQSSAAPRVLDKTFDDIKFDIEKGQSFERSMLNDQVKALFDKRIVIRGYIFPTFRSKGIKEFVLVRDNQECCFGPGAALYDCIRVTLQEGRAIEYTRSPVAVEGEFKLEERFLDEARTVGAVFYLDRAIVR